jgi:catechol 2,3-dioxygenase-like lactoylglutathione lyase family enzyme
MSFIRRFDHVGVTVADLDGVTAFFVALGLEVEGRTFVEGEFLDTVCGIPDSRTEIVMLTTPGDGARLELERFVRPDSVPGSPTAMANAHCGHDAEPGQVAQLWCGVVPDFIA